MCVCVFVSTLGIDNGHQTPYKHTDTSYRIVWWTLTAKAAITRWTTTKRNERDDKTKYKNLNYLLQIGNGHIASRHYTLIHTYTR